MSQIHLLKTKRFYPLFWTQFLGAFNDNFLKNALVIWITFKTASVFGIPSTQMVAVAGGIFILPFFLFSATAGQLADKFEKACLVRWIKIAEIGIMLLASWGLMTQRFEFLLFILFLMGLHSTFFGPIKYSILPQHLSPNELVGGNALIEAGTFLSILLGTIAGGVLISFQHGPRIVSLGLVLVAILGWLASRTIPQADAVDPQLKVQWNPVSPTLDIYRFTRRNRTVFLSVLGISWFWFFGGAILSLFPSYCKEILKTDESVVTLFLAMFSIGIGLGSLLCERLSRKHLELGLVPLGSIGMTLFCADLFCVGTPFGSSNGMGVLMTARSLIHETTGLRILADLLFMSIFSGFFIVPLYTLIQEYSEPSHRSRVIAGNNVVNAFFMVLSAIVILLMMRLKLSIPQIFLALALLNAVVAVYIYRVLPEFLLRFIIWVLANVLYRLRVIGDEAIPKKGPAVLVCNHVSFIDWVIIAAGVQRPVRFVMDHGFARGSFTRFLLKQGKVILIAPMKEDPELLRSAFVKIAEELRDGQLICLFPEGQITRDGQLNQFKSGIEKIITDTPVPVIPMALRGMWGSFFSRERGRAVMKVPKRFWSRVELKIGDPVPADHVSARLLFEKVNHLIL